MLEEFILSFPIWVQIAMPIVTLSLAIAFLWLDIQRAQTVIQRIYMQDNEQIGIKEEHETILFGPDGKVKEHRRSDDD